MYLQLNNDSLSLPKLPEKGISQDISSVHQVNFTLDMIAVGISAVFVLICLIFGCCAGKRRAEDEFGP